MWQRDGAMLYELVRRKKIRMGRESTGAAQVFWTASHAYMRLTYAEARTNTQFSCIAYARA